MLKKLFVISCAALSISCASKPEEKPKTCPLVFTAESSYTQIVQHMDAYQVILTVYHGNCVDYSVTKSSTAVIQPTFLIRRSSL